VVKTLLLLVVGAAIGYVYGYKDAKRHRQPIVERVMDRVVDRAGAAMHRSYLSSREQHADSVARQ
jgi:hypothetical protein